MPSVLITGASRGLGLEFARQYAAEGWHVIATCRDPAAAKGLKELAGDIETRKLDVTEGGDVAALARALDGAAIDLLILNAGRVGQRDRSLGSLDYGVWHDVLEVNLLGAVRVAEALVDAVARSDGRRIVAVSSRLGSIGDNTDGGSYLYRTSKAALNMAMRSLAADLAGRGIVCCVLSPGWVRTDMGGPNAALEPETSVVGMRKVIAGLGPEDSGGFFGYDGSAIPW